MGFFFVVKKDKYYSHALIIGVITIRNRYLLPLIAFVFDLLQGAAIFTKLDLQSSYHLVWIREGDKENCIQHPSGRYEYLIMPFV